MHIENLKSESKQPGRKIHVQNRMHNVCCRMPRSPLTEGASDHGLKSGIYDGPMPSTSRLCAVLAAVLALSLAAKISSPQTPPHSSAIESFRPHFQSTLHQHGIIGGGFALVHGSAPEETLAVGEMNAESHQPISAATAYNWASITKTMTAIAILQLRDRGKLSLDDPAVRYIPELREVHNQFGPIDTITIRHLLTHSAGFRNTTWPWDCDDSSNCDWQPFEPAKWSQVAAMLPYTHIAFAPGSRWSYSNPGYVFLGQIIERLSGDDFEVYIDKNILKPLGMTESYFDRAPYFLESHVSASYLRAGSKLTPQPFNFDTGITTSNSGLKAPVTNMARYLRFLIGDPGNALYEVVLKRSSLEEAWTGVLPVAEPGQPPTAYTAGANGAPPMMGLGFFILKSGSHRYIYHDGDQGGFSSEMLIDPADHCASILVVNTTDTGAPPALPELHPQSNTEPDAKTDLRQTLRNVLMEQVFPAAK
jgi:CubicO group peptidase (beta-lactamase class C family)